jgi:cytidyltransferase-like protein
MTGIIIGRFQVPFLHVGHLHLIATALRECDKVYILLGARHTIDNRNPYSVQYRIEMIKKIFPQIYLAPLWDIDRNDESWSQQIDAWASFVDSKDIVLYHSRDSFKDHYHGKLPLKEVEEIPGFSGTKLREEEKYFDAHLGVEISNGKNHLRKYISMACSNCATGINFKITEEEYLKFHSLLKDKEDN